MINCTFSLKVDTNNAVWSSGTMWRLRSWLTVVQIMTCCPTAPSHCLNLRLLYVISAWINVDLLLTRSSGIHSRMMFTSIFKISIPRLSLNWIHLKSQPHLSGYNAIKQPTTICHAVSQHPSVVTPYGVIGIAHPYLTSALRGKPSF